MYRYIIVLSFISHDSWQQTQYLVRAWRENAYHRTILNMDLWYFNKDFLDNREKGILGIIFLFYASHTILTDRLHWYKKDATFRSELFLVWFISKDLRQESFCFVWKQHQTWRLSGVESRWSKSDSLDIWRAAITRFWHERYFWYNTKRRF